MAAVQGKPEIMLAKSDMDPELEAVAAEIRKLDPDGSKSGQVLRRTFDQLYDGQRTGRYRIDQLHKTEKTHCGTLVEINLHREFEFEDGKDMDYRIAGVDVDCKFSLTKGGWMIPPEAHGHLCLLVWAEDSKDPKWRMGLVRITEDRLNTGGNRDKKATLNEVGRNAIVWLFRDSAMAPNVLLQLDRTIVDNIMGLRSGQKRINELFRHTLGMRVGRAVVATVAQQDDYMKRVRGNGGARSCLRPEGIVVLGQYSSHVAVAHSLGAALPGLGESVSVRIVPAERPGSRVAEIGGKLWRLAESNDPTVPAPILPKIKPSRVGGKLGRSR